MKGFEQLFLPLRQMQELKSHLEHGSSPALAVGLSGVQKAVAAASLMLALGRPGLILCPQESDAHRLTEDLKCLLGEEAELLRYLGQQLGQFDLEAQLGNLSRFLDQWRMQTEELKKQEERKGRLYRYLGVFAGFFLVILLM